jgi:hypothetical protein
MHKDRFVLTARLVLNSTRSHLPVQVHAYSLEGGVEQWAQI